MTLEADWTAAIVETAKKLWSVEIDPALAPPEDVEHGDFTTSVAFKLAKELRKKPQDIARELAAALKAPDLAKADVAGAGYVNLYASRDACAALIREVSATYGRADWGKGLRVNVESVSANPTGPLHIAHARLGAVGEALANLLASQGFEVTREFYVNDTGNQIRMLGESILARAENRDLPEGGYHGEYVQDLAREFGPRPVDELARRGKEKLLEALKATLARFRVSFDVWSSQEALEKSGMVEGLLNFYNSWGLTYEKDGALWLKTKDHGDADDKVLIKSDKSLVYRTPDIAYHRDKFERGFDAVIDILGSDHHAHAVTIRAALKALNLNVMELSEFMAAPRDGSPEQRARAFDVVLIQHCRLIQNGQEVKFSKRAGTYVTLDDLLDDVGVDAARYLLSMRRPDTKLDFDLDLAKKQTLENPVYYAQYAHTRIAAIWREGVEKKLIEPKEIVDGVWRGSWDPAKLGDAEEVLCRRLRTFPKILRIAAEGLDPSQVHLYLYDLSHLFQRYYDVGRKDFTMRVLCEDEPVRRTRLAVCAAVQQVVRTALSIYGVTAPDKM